MTSRSLRTTRELVPYHRYRMLSQIERSRGEEYSQELRQMDVGWPLLLHGGRFYESISSRWGATACPLPSYGARVDSLEHIMESSFDAASEITEVEEFRRVERPPPVAFLKPCRQLEKQYTANGRSLAEHLSALKGRLHKIAEDPCFHSHHHGRFTANETASKEASSSPSHYCR